MKNKPLEIKNLSFAFEDRQIFNNSNLEIKEGTFAALIGVNGAGKSTLLKLILGEHKSYKGEIRLFGDDIKRNNHHREISYISQNSILGYRNFPTTVKELILNHIKYLKLDRDISYYLKRVGLNDHREKTLSELSGGELQRLALALAFLKDSRFIILDEPTNNIDKDFSKDLFIILRNLADNGKIILMSTHNLASLEGMIDKIVHIDKDKSDIVCTDISDKVHGLKIEHIDKRRIIGF